MYGPGKTEEGVRDAFTIILMFFILIGNTLIIVAYKKNVRLQTGSNVFIVGLAASDWLVGAIAIPLYIVTLKSNSSSTLLLRFYISLDIFSGVASVFHLMFVTVERYIAISKPYLHHALLFTTYHRALGVVWLLSLALSSLDFVLTPNVDKSYPFYVLLTVFILAVMVIPSLNILIFKIARSLIRNTVEPVEQSEQGTRSRDQLRRKLHRERRTAATLAIVSLAFFVTWLPHVIGVLVFTFCFPCNLSLVDIGRLGVFIKCMQYANSALNPFVFAFRDAEMRRTIKTLMPSICFRVIQPVFVLTSDTTAVSRDDRAMVDNQTHRIEETPQGSLYFSRNTENVSC